MTAPYYVEWLSPRAIGRAARIARRAGRRTPAKADEWKTTYSSAQSDFSDLSVGLLRGSQLVGYIFARAETSGSAAVVRVLDVAVLRRHRRASTILALRFANALRSRPALRQSPILWGGPADEVSRWLERPRFFERLGYRSTSPNANALVLQPLERPRRPPATLAQALRAVRIHDTPGGRMRIGRIQTVREWALLEPWWNALLAATPGGTVFQTFEYQRAWWDHLGWSDDLWIVVVMRDDAPIAIAPFSITWVKSLGISASRLGYIGAAPESDRPNLLTSPADAPVACPAIADYLCDHAGHWDRIGLAEQKLEWPMVAALLGRLAPKGYLIRHPPGPDCPVVALRGTWQAFLAGKSKNVRKSLKRKEAALAEKGRCGYENVVGTAAGTAFERYLQVERASWKAGTAIATARAPADLAFYRDLTERFAVLGTAEMRFLSLDGQPIAATFGLVWERCYYSLHIAHDGGFDDFSPGVVLTARELEDSFAHQRYDTFDFLSGVLPNKGSWATSVTPSVDLHIVRPTSGGLLFCWVNFTLKPRAKELATRARLMPLILRVKEWLKRSELDRE
jgi:CelD/BcsL family acetyltransferase involved in cellulose biosynthesis